MPGQQQVHVQDNLQYNDRRLKRQKEDLRNNIFELVDRERKKREKNIAIIGCTGVGKSSLINTIAAALSDNSWRELSTVEPRHGSVTMEVLRVPKTEYMYMKFTKHNMPTLIDLIGFQNENSEIVRTFLSLILNGRIPNGTNLATRFQTVRNLGQTGINKLKKDCSKEYPDLKIDIVIFVASAASELPVNLINAVLEVATTKRGSTTNRDIPLFGVLTKCDKVDDMRLFLREREFLEILQIQKNRFTRITNYCDDVDRKYGIDRRWTLIYKIDVETLLFLQQVCDPARRVRNRFHRGFGIFGTAIIVAILALLLFVIQTII